MPTDAKRATVAQLKQAIAGSNAAIVADYRGLSVAELQAIRRSLRLSGVTYRIVKNRLARIAASEAGREELGDLLDGPTGLALGGTDEVALARAFLDAVRPYKAVTVRGGLIGDRRIDVDSVTRLAALPPREVMLAQLAGGIAAPLSAMASVISAPLRKLGYALSALAAQKGASEQAS